MKTLSVLVIYLLVCVGSTFAQVTPPTPGGGTKPAVFNNVALPTPAITLTTNGTAPGAMNTYGYSVAWFNLVGYGAYENEVDQDWADPLTGTNSITLHIGTCPVGAAGYIVFRGSPFTGSYVFGFQVQNSCTPGATVTWTDTGVNDPQSGQQEWSSANAQYNGLTSWNQTQGVYVPGKFTQGDLGAQTWAFYSGTNPASALLGFDVSYAEAKNAFVHAGPTQNAIDSIMGVYAASTDLAGGGISAFRAGAFDINPASVFNDGSTVNGYSSGSGNASSGVLAEARGYDGHCFVEGNGDVQLCSVYRAQNPEEIDVPGKLGKVRNMRGFSMTFQSDNPPDFPTSSLIGYYSDLTNAKSPEVWQLKLTGDAPSLIGTTVFSGLVPAPTSQGAVIFCSDCTLNSAIDDTCKAGGTGANASYINSVWRCEQ